MKKNKSQEPLLVIRAYCTDCGALLMESNPLTKKQLLANWDHAVLDAAGIVCKECAPRRCPNFHIDLKIYHKGINKEFTPAQILPKPGNPVDLNTEGLPDYLLKPLEK